MKSGDRQLCSLYCNNKINSIGIAYCVSLILLKIDIYNVRIDALTKFSSTTNAIRRINNIQFHQSSYQYM